MADLSALKIRKAPACFAEMKDMHNALCDLIGSLEGHFGIDIHITPPSKKPTKKGERAAKPKGGKIRISQKKEAGQNSASTGGGGSDAKTVHNTSGARTVTIASGAITLGNTGYQVQIQAEGMTINDLGAGTQILLVPGAHNMSVQEIDVCSGGVAKKMLVLASAPY